MPKQNMKSNGQIAYEQWQAELLNDPESRELYENDVQDLLSWHHRQVAAEQRRARKVSSSSRIVGR